ncbi:MAG: hypothetical protein JSU87_08230 [Gemmatimonadota bacterium]|nr:MAG: hypothetical protein JSU87_08230 [Gemmatimonadota bacterium]
MRSQIPITLVLAVFVTAGCDQRVPTDVEDSTYNIVPLLANDGTNNGAARWIPDPNCGVLDGDGNIVWTDCRNQIATYSGNDNALTTVKESNIPNSTGTVVRWDAYNPPPGLAEMWGLEGPPVPCGLVDTNYEFTLFTTKWSATISPSGEAKLICHYTTKWKWEPPEGWESPF